MRKSLIVIAIIIFLNILIHLYGGFFKEGVNLLEMVSASIIYFILGVLILLEKKPFFYITLIFTTLGMIVSSANYFATSLEIFLMISLLDLIVISLLIRFLLKERKTS